MICIDTLELTLTSVEDNAVFNYAALGKDYKPDEVGMHEIGDSYTLHRINTTEKGYAYSLSINKNNHQIGILYLNSSFPDKRLVKLSFANPIFYHTDMSWHEYYKDICRLLRLRFNNISTLHIAFDAVGMFNWYSNKHFNSTSIPTLEEPDYDYISREEPSKLGVMFVIVDSWNKQSRKDKKNKSVKVKVNVLYQKTLEIEESGKGYINEAHILNGLDVSQGVDRLETRLQAKWIRDNKVTLEDLLTQQGLDHIFVKATANVGFDDLKAPKIRNHDYKYKAVRLLLVEPSTFNLRPLQKIKGKSKADQLPDKNEKSIMYGFKKQFDDYILAGRVQGIWNLRFYMNCEENYIGADKKSFHKGLIEPEELSRDKYRTMVKRYVKNYTKNRENITEGILSRLKSVEHDLFDKQESTKTRKLGENEIKIANAASAFFSTTFYLTKRLVN
jgi:hypothetical protein